MSTSKIWRALGAVKDQTSIGLAKVGSSASLAELDVAIVKATRHNEYPAEEKHIKEILSLTCYSRGNIGACVATISRRLNKTRSWTVALKALILIQRLLQEGDPAYEQEIFFATRRGTRLLNMSDFRDSSKSNAWEFSAFVRTYALYLDERLEYNMQMREMRIDVLFAKMQHLQLLLERFLACRPTGAAKNHRIVIVALYPILKESFHVYYEITEILGILIDRFVDMQVPECIKVYDIFCRVGKQYDELELFYTWNKSMGIARSSEFPEIDRITPRKLEIMDEFIRDKSAIAQSKRIGKPQEDKVEEPQKEEPPQEDVNEIKALPPPEGYNEEVKEVEPEEPKVVQTEGDLLNLGDDDAVTTSNDHANQMALALFDGVELATCNSASTTPALTWRAFDDGSDWETALVQSASSLKNQKPALGGGFDTLLLDGMYNQAAAAAIPGSGYGVGSASSVALGSAGRPAMLALPAPPTPESHGSSWISADPFAASMMVAPPAYVQMSEMEKKQRLLVEEQLLWQQYTSNGMQGHANITRMHPMNYMGGQVLSGHRNLIASGHNVSYPELQDCLCPFCIGSPYVRALSLSMASGIPVTASSSSLSNIAKTGNVVFNHHITAKLDDKNFLVWKQQVLASIRGHRLTDFIAGAEAIPKKFEKESDAVAGTLSEKYIAWIEQDQLLLSWLLSTMSDSMQTLLVGIDHSYLLWDKVAEYFATHTLAKVHQYRAELRTVKKGSKTVTEFLLKIKSIVDSLIAIGSPVSKAVLDSTVKQTCLSTFNVTTSSKSDDALTLWHYSEQYKGYKCLASNGRIFMSRDVQFDESLFPFAVKSSKPSVPPLVKSLLPSAIPPKSSHAQSAFDVHTLNGTTSTSFQPSISDDTGSPNANLESGSTSSNAVSSSVTPPNAIPVQEQVVSAPVAGNTHSMVTRAKNGVFKPKVYLSQK
ncbi:putative clathrin assembly protein [Senna tora]|uniref:Putative clathrin assembly protein n=1 Tax=Senna tora TaxID=362788 RepID=A0A834SML8_9FABA|nr:putative clathrin assembly protein [Senna tora]